MLRIVLYQPEIPPNTGNIIRLCANTGCALHLIEPLGFDLEDKKMRRAGLDYGEYSSVSVHEDLESFRKAEDNPREFALSTRGSTPYTEARFAAGDAIIFGPETRGLPGKLLDELGPAQCLRVPMKPESRSLNLSNAVALVAYEGLRQLEFEGLV